MKSIPLVTEELLNQVIEWIKAEIEHLKKKKRKSKADLLLLEYAKTFLNNPTPVNYILMSCGRADEMKRKEEIEVDK